MKRMATTAVFAVLAMCAAGPRASHAQTLFFDYVGFDYESPNPNPGVFGEPGSGYVGLGFVPGLFAPLVADTASNQYTYVISSLSPVSQTAFGTFVIINYGPGSLSIYEDSKSSGTPADYGSNPPSAVAPATFTDGTLFLTGTLTNFQIVLNTANGTGSYEANFEVTGGSQLVNVPSNQRTGWTFAGASGNALNIPPGYAHQIDGQTFLNQAVRVRSASWGGIKARYER